MCHNLGLNKMHWRFLNRKGTDNVFQIFKISRPMVHNQLPTLVYYVFYHALGHEKGISSPGYLQK